MLFILIFGIWNKGELQMTDIKEIEKELNENLLSIAEDTYKNLEKALSEKQGASKVKEKNKNDNT